MRQRKSLTAAALSLSLLSGGLTAFAQDRRPARGEQQRQSEAERKERVERELILTQHGGDFHIRVPGPAEPGAPPFGRDTFVYLSTEMSLPGKTVKGAPYSAEAVTETVQTLADGNRIVRKNTAQVYRDGEGRTRREFTLNALGPWASQDDAPRTVSIVDPVAGVSYSLDARTRTAHKVPLGPMRSLQAAPGGPTEVFSILRSGRGGDVKPVDMKGVKSTLQGRVLSKAEAVNASGLKEREMVAVKIKVGASGAVESAEAVVGENAALRAAAVEAARKWSFKPGEAETGAILFKFDGRASAPGEIARVFEMSKEETANGAKATTVLAFDEPGVETQQLGKQLVEGVEAEGTRTTRTIPAGEIGNEQPIRIVSERWYSPELQVVVMTRHSDPRMGETTYKLTNVVRGEPSAALFQVPSDYAVREAPAFGPRALRRSKVPAPDFQ